MNIELMYDEEDMPVRNNKGNAVTIVAALACFFLNTTQLTVDILSAFLEINNLYHPFKLDISLIYYKIN